MYISPRWQGQPLNVFLRTGPCQVPSNSLLTVQVKHWPKKTGLCVQGVQADEAQRVYVYKVCKQRRLSSGSVRVFSNGAVRCLVFVLGNACVRTFRPIPDLQGKQP